MTTAPPFYPNGPIAIRDGALARVRAAAPSLTGVFTARTMPGQDDLLPFAVVWNSGEKTEPMGDPNTGAPGFLHRLTLVVDVLTRAADETTLDTNIVNLTETIRSSLLSDLTWVMLVEGIERCDTRYDYPKEAGTVMAQAMIEFEVTYRSIWQPVVPNDLRKVVVIGRPAHATAPCPVCHAANAPERTGCSVCGASLCATDPIITTIALEGTS